MELISQQALVRHMRHQDLSVAELAKRIGRSKATIGHLHCGGRTTTSSATAKAIEKALGLPPCTLFLPKVEPRNGHQSPPAPPRRIKKAPTWSNR